MSNKRLQGDISNIVRNQQSNARFSLVVFLLAEWRRLVVGFDHRPDEQRQEASDFTRQSVHRWKLGAAALPAFETLTGGLFAVVDDSKPCSISNLYGSQCSNSGKSSTAP